jgi:hypothetical protein
MKTYIETNAYNSRNSYNTAIVSGNDSSTIALSLIRDGEFDVVVTDTSFGGVAQQFMNLI